MGFEKREGGVYVASMRVLTTEYGMDGLCVSDGGVWVACVFVGMLGGGGNAVV